MHFSNVMDALTELEVVLIELFLRRHLHIQRLLLLNDCFSFTDAIFYGMERTMPNLAHSLIYPIYPSYSCLGQQLSFFLHTTYHINLQLGTFVFENARRVVLLLQLSTLNSLLYDASSYTVTFWKPMKKLPLILLYAAVLLSIEVQYVQIISGALQQQFPKEVGWGFSNFYLQEVKKKVPTIGRW